MLFLQREKQSIAINRISISQKPQYPGPSPEESDFYKNNYLNFRFMWICLSSLFLPSSPKDSQKCLVLLFSVGGAIVLCVS